MVGRLGPNLRPRQQIQNRRPSAPRSQARRGARDVSRTDGPDRAEQSDELIGLLAHEVAQTQRASIFWTFSIVKGTQRLVFRTVQLCAVGGPYRLLPAPYGSGFPHTLLAHPVAGTVGA